MNPLDHYPEPFNATGSVPSEGVLNQLGRPRMGPVEVLVREAVQNCWDAKRADSDQVTVEISLVEFGARQRRNMAHKVFADLPPDEDAPELRQVERALLIRDRGTWGLGGVLRADEEGEAEPRDFVDYLRNIGQAPDTQFGGGTYGYGKAAFFLTSRLRTILVHTHCLHRGRPEARLMGARLGEQYSANGRLYTGRHWWGRLAGDGIIDPVLDQAADELAAGIGLPAFDVGERGTTIAILEPDFGSCSDLEAMEVVGKAIVWHFWPKMVAAEGARAPMIFRVSCPQREIELPDLESHPVLGAFREALLTLKTLGEGDDDIEEPDLRTRKMFCWKPKQYLGRLALKKFPLLAPTSEDASSNNEGEAACERPGLPPGRVHHAALLRVPELVVTYQPGPEPPTPRVSYAGVFLADVEMDRIYARSEPPTHDDWVPDGLEDPHHRTFIRMTTKRIGEAMDEFSGSARLDTDLAGGSSLGGLSEQLSGLLPGVEGPGARVQPSGPSAPGGDGPKTRRPRVRLEGDPVLESFDGRPVMTVSITVSVPEESGSAAISAHPFVVVDTGTREKDAPSGAERPRVIRWTGADGSNVAGATDRLTGIRPGEALYRVSTTIPDDAQVALDITVSSEAER